jgi:hypothetical protein
MGLRVSVYRNAERGLQGDFTNGGISGKYGSLTLVNVSGPSEPTDDAPAAMLVHGNLGTAIIVPAIWSEGTREWQEQPSQTAEGPARMFGGNYAGTSDSRFHEAVRRLIGQSHVAVAIHDRSDTWADYEMLSR